MDDKESNQSEVLHKKSEDHMDELIKEYQSLKIKMEHVLYRINQRRSIGD